MRIGDRITSDQVIKKHETSKSSINIIEKTKNDNWLLDVSNPLSPISPFNPCNPLNIINWDF